MNKLSESQIIEFYTSDISSYCEVIKNDTIVIKWDELFLDTYWSNFHKFLKISDNHIRNILIPRLDNKGLNTLIKSIKIEKLTFENCTFLDSTLFENINIIELNFTYCVFHRNLNFTYCTLSKVIIKSINIASSLMFDNCEINTLLIDRGLFFESVYFSETKFLKWFKLDSPSIHKLSFNKILFNSQKESLLSTIKGIDENQYAFENLLTIEKYYILYENELKRENEFAAIFSRLDDKGFKNFLNDELSSMESGYKKDDLEKTFRNYFEHKKNSYSYKPNISLENCLVTDMLTFYSIDLTNFSFRNSNIEKVNFLECKWNIKSNRLILSSDRGYGIDSQYRQLKRIFKKQQNWHMSSLSHISEMEASKRQLGYHLDENKLRYFTKHAFEYIIFHFYSFFGGYAQNYVRPLIIFLISTFLFFPILYMYLEVNELNIISYLESLQKSISNSFPIIKTELKYKSWALKSIQTLFSTIMLTFTILGFRNRFKQ